jgi:hypothetical protein
MSLGHGYIIAILPLMIKEGRSGVGLFEWTFYGRFPFPYSSASSSYFVEYISFSKSDTPGFLYHTLLCALLCWFQYRLFE